jgi:hypothetical protein
MLGGLVVPRALGAETCQFLRFMMTWHTAVFVVFSIDK